MKQKIYSCLTAILAVVMITMTVAAETPSISGGKDIRLPAYFQEILDHKEIKVICAARRDDLGIELSAAPMDINCYVNLLTNLKLQAAPTGGKLAVVAPFTLRFTHAKKTDAFAFSKDGVRYGGVLYFPENPAALTEFYTDDVQKFFSQAYYPLGKDLEITAEQVTSVTLHRSHYNDEISMHLTEKKPITALLEEQRAVLVRKTAGETDGPISVGGSVNETVYTLRDGTVIRFGDNGGMATLQKGKQKIDTYQILRGIDSRAQFNSLMDSYTGVPKLTATLGGKKLERIYRTAFSYGGETKAYKNDIPLEYLYDKHIYLPIRAGNTARFTFSETPSQVTAQIFLAENEKKGASHSATVSADGALALPSDPGDYFLTLHAVFPRGTVDYLFGFTVSDLPEFFDSIEYGNDMGGVTITRDDLGRSVVCGQNRQYVTFLQKLDLVPAQDNVFGTVSQIKKPLTITFSCAGYPDQKFSFSTQESNILYNGKPYRAQNTGAIQQLYAPFDPMNGDTIFDDTKGFLTAECTTFGALYPLDAKDISTLKVEQKHLYRRSVSVDAQGKTTYGFQLDTLSSRDVKPSEFASTLKQVHALLLAKEEQNADAYDYGKYTAYTLTLKDGRQFSLDRRLTIDKKPSGYYLLMER